MAQQLAAEILTSDSDEIADLKANLSTLDGFIALAREIDAFHDTKKRFFEESRSLYQVTVVGRDIQDLESLLTGFFGSPAKPSGKPLPRKLNKNSVVKYLGGLQKDQSLFLLSLKTGQFYGALWPWRRNKAKIEIHLGYCSDWMSDDDYEQLETLVQHTISHSTFQKMGTDIGGQIHGISLPSFLQMAEMEKSSFSLRITSYNRVGNLHLDDGTLINADFDQSSGAAAAYQVISWDEASIEIEPLDASKTDEIKQPLMHVLMESLKLKDEAVVTTPETDKIEEAEIEDTASLPQKPTPRSQRPAPGRLVRLERAPDPKHKGKGINWLTLAAIAVGAVGMIVVAFMVSHHFANNRRASDGFDKLESKVEQTKSLNKKVSLLQEYLDSYPNSHHSAEIQSKILTISNKIEDLAYDKVQLKISTLAIDEQYEKQAVSAYEEFLSTYPNSRHKREINQSITKIKDLIDQYYYEELKQAARLKLKDRLKIYRDYLAKFPEGSHGKDVKVLIDKMGKRHLEYINTEINKCETKQRWEPCIKEFNELIDAYEGLPLGDKAGVLKAQMVDKRDFFQLRRQVIDTGVNYQKGYQLYQSYLSDHPQTTQKEAIKKEMAELSVHLTTQKKWLTVRRYATNDRNALIRRIRKIDQYLKKNSGGPFAGEAQSLLNQLESERKLSLREQQALSRKRKEQERIQREKALIAQQKRRARQLQTQIESQLKGSNRYRTNGDGTFKDQTTGLTWVLLDSQQELNGCITYEAAQTYVQALNHGGKQDWRLPTASELASIYKKPPYFPSTGNKWFWSSETFDKGYHKVVVVVTDKAETTFKRDNRTLSECGVARAVR